MQFGDFDGDGMCGISLKVNCGFMTVMSARSGHLLVKIESLRSTCAWRGNHQIFKILDGLQNSGNI